MRVDKKTKGVALVTVLVFMLLVTIIAGAALTIMTKQARLAEHQIRRIKGFYAAESAINKAYQSLRYMDTNAVSPVGQPNNTAWGDSSVAGVWQWTWNSASPGGGFEWRVEGDANPGDITRDRSITVYYNTTNGDVIIGGVTVPQGGGLQARVDYGA